MNEGYQHGRKRELNYQFLNERHQLEEGIDIGQGRKNRRRKMEHKGKY